MTDPQQNDPASSESQGFDSGQSVSPNGNTSQTKQNSGQRAFAARKINYRHSSKFVPILEHLGCSLLVSTYAAGKVASIGAADGELHLRFSNFQQAMGIAIPDALASVDAGAANVEARDAEIGKSISARTLAVGGPNLVWFMRDAGSLARQVEPAGTYDRAFLARESFVTGNISIHEMAWGHGQELWMVNTLFSCLATLHPDYNFVPRWQPPFIDGLAPQDRCHLNGMAMIDGRPRYVTCLGTSNEARGWREGKVGGGALVDVDSGEVITKGFCMPHSPRWHQGKLFLLDSGRGQLVAVDLDSGKVDVVSDYPGYGRGLAFAGQFAFVGMSRARETSVFGGVPICDDTSRLRCGIVVIDLASGRNVAFLEFESGIEELFDVQVIEHSRRTVLCGPYPQEDQQVPVWVVPPEIQTSGRR
ncbi:TIGR03032 family protein [Stieleria sp. JC731]|uniref:TIGR03032 family protein n=1 Tax=Pirellulaceae TaxID=2691357 RepID=UPI001E3ABEBF|nr:TIGR03032 family protein [Stieleria sp. JC731]MCC9599848.1 TIGR03032 family protein [Stieleria sp. JC731]